MSQQRNRRYEREPNRNFKIEKYNNQKKKKKSQYVNQIAEWKGQREKTNKYWTVEINWSEKEDIPGRCKSGVSLRDLWECKNI